MRAIVFPILMIIAVLSGCATPVVMLKSDTSGQTVRCGGGTTGSIVGGAIGYSIEKDSDAKCVKDYESKGFKKV